MSTKEIVKYVQKKFDWHFAMELLLRDVSYSSNGQNDLFQVFKWGILSLSTYTSKL